MERSRKIMLVGGLLLTLWGMGYGLYYALFDEHQTLERMGERLVAGFAHAANREMPQARAALGEFGETKFEYVREVDVHSHWTGLAMLLVLFGIVFDRVAFDERWRCWLAILLVVGSVLFPLGVILQTVDRGLGPQALAVLGAVALIVALGAVAAGFARSGRR